MQIKASLPWALAVAVLLPSSAYAYIDMGTGAYMVQALIAVVGALVLFVRHPIQTIKSWWRHLRRGDDE